MSRPHEGEVPVGLSPFAGETRWGHALVLLAGVLGFLAGYLGSALLFFEGIATFAPGSPRLPSLLAAAFGSLGCWGAFAAAFVRGRGGPVLNALVYPIAVVTIVPVVVRWTLFGPNLAGMLDRLGFVLFPVEVIVTALALVVPGVAFFTSLLALWASSLEEEQRRSWQREQLTREFYEEFTEESER